MATEIKSARDALEKIEKLAHCDLSNVYPKYRAEFDAKIGGIERIAKAALALPRRNCDVGTPEEQYGRHDKYCNSQPTCKKCLREDAASMCISCFAEWAQMPYEAEEGGAE